MSDENGSLLDSIGATLTETYSKLNADEATAQTVVEPETTETATQETEAERAERLRDERGRFAKAQEEAQAEPVQEEAEPAPVVAKAAPGSWPNEMKAKFSELPPDVQDYVLKRESDVSRSINAYSQKAKEYDRISGVLSPYEGILRADGLEPVGVINGLMQTYYQLRNGAPQQKAAAVAQLMQQFGVDLSHISEDGQQPGNSAYVDPQLYAKVSQLEQELRNRQLAEQQAEQAQVQATIEQFKANAPHFDSVAPQVGALLQSGQAKDLQEAYEMACWAHPEVRATLLREQEAKRRDEAARIAAAAKKASAVNVTSRGTMPPAKPLGSMEDTMREAYQRLVGNS